MKKIMLMISLASSQFVFAATMQDALKEYGIKLDGAHAGVVIKDQHLSGSSKSQHWIEAKTPADEHFEIKIISPLDQKAASALIASEASTIKKIYSAPQTPYMGDIAQAIGGCPTTFGPLEKKITMLKQDATAVLGAADDKFKFGACSSEQAKYKGAYLAYYDESSKSLWTWRIFVPWKTAADFKSDWLSPVLKRFQK